MFDKIKPGPTPIRVGDRPEDAHEYFVDTELAQAANIAIFLARPLLISGEAGTGKTELAYAIAAQLEMREPLEFHCKSDSVGRDLLYRVDHLGRLHDAYAAGAAHTAQLAPLSSYVHDSTLRAAFRSDDQRVVLIDEIDKAPPDLPNDLLDELDRGRIRIPEISETHEETAKQRPIVIITSNRERELPRPFLRRCIFHYIEYPSSEQLRRIVTSRLHDKQVAAGFIALIVSRFEELRGVPNLVKPPATGELVMWSEVLLELGIEQRSLEQVQRLADLPAIQALIKRKDDLELTRNSTAAPPKLPRTSA